MPEDTSGAPDGAPVTAPDPAPAPAAPDPAPAQGPDLKAELEKLTREARKWEDRAKANATAAKELETLRQQSMTDQERAVAEAKAAGRSEAIATFASQLVDAELRAAAAGRIDDKALGVLLQGLNRSAFLLDDGTVDTKSVREFVEGIAPKPPEPPTGPPQFPDLGQGTRGPVPALNGDPLLAHIKSKLGIT